MIHSRRTRAAVITAILAVCLGVPVVVIALGATPTFGFDEGTPAVVVEADEITPALLAEVDKVKPGYPGNCSVKQGSSRTAAAYCRSMENDDGYRVRGKRNTWQGVVTFAGNWADASDENGSYYTAPSGSTIVSGSLWVQKADCCFNPF